VNRAQRPMTFPAEYICIALLRDIREYSDAMRKTSLFGMRVDLSSEFYYTL
jgi:hypothetical protein